MTRGPITLRSVSPDLPALTDWIAGNLSRLTGICRHIHSNPELSGQEVKTAALVARELEAAGCRLHTGIGGHGVAGVLANGDGPCILVRGDMDALPIVEETDLPYASTVRATGDDGAEVGVMHACGHDVHTTILIGVGQALAALRDHWRGTVVLIGQPAEEVGNGADQMVRDGLFDRVPKPEACLALHVAPDMPVGQAGCASGWASATVDSVDIVIHGRGGHGARPNLAIDPIVIAANVITQLQTLVSRRVDPLESAVVTVGSIHGGSKHNVIPDEVRMQLTVRSYSNAVRAELLGGIGRITMAACASAGCTQQPDVAVVNVSTPACYNDPALAEAALTVFRTVLGAENAVVRAPKMWSEDFGFFPRALDVPGLQFDLGAVAPDRLADANGNPTALPGLHSSRFAPDHEGTVETGIRAMASLVLSLLADPA